MKRLMIALTVLFAFSSSAFAQMGNSQGGGMMRGDSWDRGGEWDTALAPDGS